MLTFFRNTCIPNIEINQIHQKTNLNKQNIQLRLIINSGPCSYIRKISNNSNEIILILITIFIFLIICSSIFKHFILILEFKQINFNLLLASELFPK